MFFCKPHLQNFVAILKLEGILLNNEEIEERVVNFTQIIIFISAISLVRVIFS